MARPVRVHRQRFTLKDLLPVMSQRIMKYPMLLEALYGNFEIILDRFAHTSQRRAHTRIHDSSMWTVTRAPKHLC